MTAGKNIAVSVAIGILVGAFVLLAVSPEFASGKDRYDKSAFLFPYAFLTLHLFGSPAVLPLLMLPQFPLYGWFYGWAWSKQREHQAIALLLASHLVLGVTSAVLYKIDYLVSRGISPF
jgi:hypothetical protein